MKTTLLPAIAVIALAASHGWVARPALPGDNFQLAHDNGMRTQTSEGNGPKTQTSEGNGPKTQTSEANGTATRIV